MDGGIRWVGGVNGKRVWLATRCGSSVSRHSTAGCDVCFVGGALLLAPLCIQNVAILRAQLHLNSPSHGPPTNIPTDCPTGGVTVCQQEVVSQSASKPIHHYSRATLFPKQFTVRGSQCLKEWSPWWMAWSGSRPACLPLPFICLPVLFICLPGVLVVRFPAGLSPTFICFPLLFMCLPLPFICPPLLFICLPVLFICLPGWVLVVGFPAGWVLVVGFPAGLSPTSFNLSPTSFHLSPTSFHLSPRLGACGPVPGWLVSHFLSFVSQARCLWSGSGLTSLHLSPISFYLSPTSFHLSRLACLPLP